MRQGVSLAAMLGCTVREIGCGVSLGMSALPGFNLPGDVSASERYWEEDVIVPPVEVGSNGPIQVLTAPGLGFQVNRKRVEALMVNNRTGRPWPVLPVRSRQRSPAARIPATGERFQRAMRQFGKDDDDDPQTLDEKFHDSGACSAGGSEYQRRAGQPAVPRPRP